MAKITCNLSAEERLLKKAELLRLYQERTSKYPQYAKYPSRFRLGLMLKAWRKNGFTFAAAGDYVLFFKKTYAPGVPAILTEHPYTMFSGREVDLGTYGKSGGDSHYACREGWILDCES